MCVSGVVQVQIAGKKHTCMQLEARVQAFTKHDGCGVPMVNVNKLHTDLHASVCMHQCIPFPSSLMKCIRASKLFSLTPTYADTIGKCMHARRVDDQHVACKYTSIHRPAGASGWWTASGWMGIWLIIDLPIG